MEEDGYKKKTKNNSRSRRYLAETITDLDYRYDLALLTRPPPKSNLSCTDWSDAAKDFDSGMNVNEK